jgi:hypothetical protein
MWGLVGPFACYEFTTIGHIVNLFGRNAFHRQFPFLIQLLAPFLTLLLTLLLALLLGILLVLRKNACQLSTGHRPVELTCVNVNV